MALDFSTIRNTIMWVLIAVAVIGLVVAIIVRKIVGKIVTLVVAAVIVFFGWQQRSKVVDYYNQHAPAQTAVCEAVPKFFGVDVTGACRTGP